MRPLDRNLRNQLEAAINEAREIAEKAARAALEQLGVHEAAPYDFLDEDARDLRRRLRSHGRRLGDTLLDKRQTLDNLVEDVAYQHWHRMLFAKFLAENDLLMYPDPNDPVAVTLEECEELANDEGASNGWELAARFASQMLPQIFQLDSPIFELSLPPEHQHKLENIVSAIPSETFKASDSLGWVYQFWQSKRKKSVNDAEVKIGAKELPAVTQLFTEPYMVEWLLRTSDLSSLPRLADASHPLSPPPMRGGKGGNGLIGEVILFIDGLRLDAGKRLAEQLEKRGFTVSERHYWNPLPSITATGKPAVSPVAEQIMGDENATDFEPSVRSTGQSLKGGYHLKKQLMDAGYQILDSKNTGDIQGKAWCEFGNIDSEGHHRGWKLAKYLDFILSEIVERISGLFDAGWKRIQIVTDHGWLLSPGGLPKIELPSCLTESKWGRCAALKSGVQSDVLTMPWYWNSDVEVALANGISCFKSGLDYAHGGLSLQECAVPCYIVESKTATISHIDITDVKWRGLRCDVAVDGEYCGLNVDIRTHAGDVGTSVVMGIKPFKSSGKASVVVEDDGLEGTLAVILVIDNAGNIMAQVDTVIGGK